VKNREALILVLMSLYLGSRLEGSLGNDGFYFLLLCGWILAAIWTFAAYRRGERVFIWQKRNG
jgi:Na+-driven multidrug efflux pump